MKVRNSRRRTAGPQAEHRIYTYRHNEVPKFRDVRFGPKPDPCAAKTHVRFAPDSDRKSERSQPVMSALTPKADMCSAMGYFRFGPKADIHFVYSITSSARLCTDCGTVRPSFLAVLRLMISSTFVACWTGKSAGFSPFRIFPV